MSSNSVSTTNTDKQKSKENIENILSNYQNYENDIITQLKMLSQHGVTQGSVREEIWRDFFNSIVPNKFVIDRGVFIIDSYGRVSNEVDIAIYDNSYTPYVFAFKCLKYIPIEAVAAVVECKSYTSDDKLKAWSTSIDNLQTSNCGMARMATGFATGKTQFQNSTKPIKIFCGLEDEYINKKGETAKHVHTKEIIKNYFDISIICNTDKTEMNINYNFWNYTNYLEWLNNKGEIIKDSRESINDILYYLNQINVSELNKKQEYDIDKSVTKESLLKNAELNKIIANYYTKSLETPKLVMKSNLDDGGTKDSRIEGDRLLSYLKVHEMGINKKPSEKVMPIPTFLFTFNQILMLINNPILFPHFAYANLFNNFEEVLAKTFPDDKNNEE